MRAGARLDRCDARGIDHPGPPQALGVLPGDEIVGDDGEIDAVAHEHRDQRLDEGGLAGAHGAADADTGGRGWFGGHRHRNM